MLYDQALLVFAYVETYNATNNIEYKNTVEEVLTYIARDMTAPDGGFYSAEDADSEGEEGKFYTWANDELVDILVDEGANFISKIYNSENEGNFKDQATQEKTGINIPYLTKTISEIAEDYGVTLEETKTRIMKIRKQLFEVREKRIHPHKDDKILTDWNGLMIAAYALA